MSREPSQLELLYATRSPSRNAAAVERTIRALRSADRLEGVDAALLAAARTTARALDHAPNPYVAGTVARVHLAVILQLSGRPASEPDDLDIVRRLLERPAALGHGEDR